MSLILDALKKARQLAQGKSASPQAQNLMKSFGFNQRMSRRRTQKTILYVAPALVLATGIAVAANYWLKSKPESTVALMRPEEPTAETATPPAAPPADALPEPATPPAPADPVVRPPASPDPAPSQRGATATPAPKAPSSAASPSALQTASPRTGPTSAGTATAGVAARPPANGGTETASGRPTATTLAPVPLEAPAAAAATPSAPEAPARDPYDAMNAYFSVGSYARALEECKKALVKYPESARVYGNCGAVYIMLNRSQEAMEALTYSIRLDGNNAYVFNYLGSLYLQLRELGSALGAFEKSALLDDKKAEPFFNMGLVHMEQGAPELAKIEFQKAIQRDARHARAHLNLARVYDRQGESGKALASFKAFKALALGLPDFRSDVENANERIRELEKQIPTP